MAHSRKFYTRIKKIKKQRPCFTKQNENTKYPIQQQPKPSLSPQKLEVGYGSSIDSLGSANIFFHSILFKAIISATFLINMYYFTTSKNINLFSLPQLESTQSFNVLLLTT